MSQPVASTPPVSNLHYAQSLATGSILVQKFTRGHGETVWRHPRHRIVLPLTGADTRKVTVQFAGGRTREFVWHDFCGFYPAETEARIVTTPATAFHLLWTPDPATAGTLEPRVPFDDPLISINAHAVARELGSGAPDRLLVECLGSAIIIKMMRHFTARVAETSRANGLSRERLRRIVEYVDAHLGDELTLDALASVACLSPHHLSRSFQRAMGVGLHRYVVQRRIEHAKRLVVETDLSMAEIAWTVGFGSQAAFTTRFRREVGHPPTQLRHDR